MKDIIDRYEDSKFPALLEVLFFMILILDLIIAIWISFMAPLHIGKIPYLRIVYFIVIPVAYIAPIADAVAIRKAKKNLLLINNVYLIARVAYLGFFFINEIVFRLSEVSTSAEAAVTSGIINAGIFNIAFTLVFSAFWIIAINASKAIRYHISN